MATGKRVAESGLSRRRALAGGAALAGAATLAACGGAGSGPAQVGPQPGPPKRVVFVKSNGGEVKDRAWRDAFAQASKATNVTVDVEIDPDSSFYEKRLAEFAAGSSNFDLMNQALNWVLLMGLKGVLVDFNPLWKRDKWEAAQYYKADLESWTWKGHLWAMPYQFGGETWMFNKALFAAKGVKPPSKDWTYDDLLQMCQKLNDPAANFYAIQVGQNTVQYMFGTFLRNFGGKVLDDQRAKALYGDDPNALRGAELNVDLHQKYGVAWTAALLKTLPAGTTPMRSKLGAIEVNGLASYVDIAASIGMENLDFAPPPKGPSGIQQVRVAGNSWSMLALSKNQDAAWTVLKWLHTKEGMLSPQLEAISWPPLIWAATEPKWADRFKGTHIQDLREQWQKAGHNQVVLPEGDALLSQMNAPLTKALNGDITAREALRQSADMANATFAQRPKEWG